MPTTLFAQQDHQPFYGQEAGDDADVHYIHHPKALYIISENEYVRSLIPSAARVKASPNQPTPIRRIGSSLRPLRQSQTTAMTTTLTYTADTNMAAPGSPPDLTNSKSSKSSSFHSSSLPDTIGHHDLSHFEDINLDDLHGGPSSFHVPASPSNRVIFEASRSSSFSGTNSRNTHAVAHSFRDLTGNSRPRYPSLKGQVNSAVRPQSGLNAPGRSMRRGFTSPSAPSLANASLAAPTRRSRSPSPSKPQAFPSVSRSSSRSSSRKLDVSPTPSMINRRQSWQHAARKTAKEREAECDDEDDELPDDAIIWNVPISPRPAQERSPAPSTCGSPPQSVYSPANSRPVSLRGESSSKTSPVIPARHFSPGPLSPNPANKENVPPPQGLVRQRTNTWENTYTALDEDAKKVTEALEQYQTELEGEQELKRQQPTLSRSSSTEKWPETKSSRTKSLPPLRKSDPLIDPFQPSVEKQKYLSRTRPSWLPPKNPKEEKKHLKEYQKMLARIEEADRLEAQRQQAEAEAREKAERVKAEYWTNLLLPNWGTEMVNPESKGTHRKMWWNGIPNKLRGTIWKKAIGNDLEVSENTFNIALKKANDQIKELGDAAIEGRVKTMIANTNNVFPSLKMFAPATTSTSTNEQNETVDVEVEAQPLHQDLLNVCLAYSSYRSDVDTTASIHHIAGLFLLNMSVSDTFTTLCNLLNRPVPLSFLVRDHTAMTAAYGTTLSALSKKCPTLATRLSELRVEPRDYMDSMLSSLFCERLDVEKAARVMDVYSIEGDKIPPRVALGVMMYLEGRCYEGGKDEVSRVLREREVGEGADEFMGRVYEAGKSGK